MVLDTDMSSLRYMYGKGLQINKLEQGQDFTCNHTIYDLIAKQSGFH